MSGRRRCMPWPVDHGMDNWDGELRKQLIRDVTLTCNDVVHITSRLMLSACEKTMAKTASVTGPSAVAVEPRVDRWCASCERARRHEIGILFVVWTAINP